MRRRSASFPRFVGRARAGCERADFHRVEAVIGGNAMADGIHAASGICRPRVRPTAQRAIKGDSHVTGGAFKVAGAVARDDGTIVPGTHFVEVLARPDD
jgi:hypothetical protein